MVNYNGIDRIYHLLKLAGWAFNPNWSRARKKAQFFIGAFTYLSVFVTFGSDLSALPKLVRDKNYELVFAGIGEMQAETCCLLNAFLLMVYAEKIRQINTALKETFKFASEYSPEESASIFPQNWRKSNKVLNLELGYFCSLMFAWVGAPIYDLVSSYPNIDYQNAHLILNNADYGLDKSHYYWYITAFHLVMAAIIPSVVGLGFSLAPLTCTLIRGQVAILVRSFKKVHELPLTTKTGKTLRFGGAIIGSLPPAGFKKINRLNAFGNGSRFEDNGIDLKDCIKHHQMILRVLKKAEKLLAHFLFWNIAGFAVGLINNAVALTTANSIYPILLYSVTVIMLLVQLFFLTWHLTILKETCFEVSFAAFSVSNRHPKVQRNLSLIICRSNREETFSCVLVTSLTFAGVFKLLRLLWSYLTLCNQKIRTNS